MGIGLIATLVALAVFGVIYGVLRFLCFVKKKYCEAENFICRFLGHIMCESCKESCDNHRRLLMRAILFTAVILAVMVIGHCYWR
ncbi:MAG: hypothetical protein WCF77_00275 [Minisyncoccia bacterium]